MTEETKKRKQETITLVRLGTIIKTWLPIILTVGSLVVGYFLFKSETAHQFELQQRDTAALQGKVQRLYDEVNENRRLWQTNIETQLTTTRETLIRLDMRLENLEND